MDSLIALALLGAGAATIAALPWSDEEISKTADAADAAFFAAIRCVTNPIVRWIDRAWG
jgi:hypothetical protein